MGRACGAVGIILVLCVSCLPGIARGHGSMGDPISRVYQCFQEGPENPTSAACREAVALSGTQAFYDWNEVNLPNAAGRHRQLIPDGKLCSAGREKYKGLDQARDDWRARPLPSGEPFTFLYRVTAVHRGFFEFYVTRNGYQPTEPLKWADLEDLPFINVTEPRVVGNYYQIPGTTPAGKAGRHLIYVIWQRSDSPEAFYACSDVDFDATVSLHSTT